MLKHLYVRFMEIFPGFDQVDEALTLKNDGFMDLNLHIMAREKEQVLVSLSHYREYPLGDVRPDPDVELVIYPEPKELEVLSYHDPFGYRQVYLDFPDKHLVDPQTRYELNDFLGLWLRNLKVQGFRQ